MKKRRWLLAIVVLSVLLRVGVALYLGDTVPVGKDENSYSLLAQRLATGHGYSFPTPWYPSPAGARLTGRSSTPRSSQGSTSSSAPTLAARLVQAIFAGL